ncbi:MAG TPA: patatin-like phospholipase family protein [Xanthobacteraceae bacterium]|nr:patatin-like phospholipase family protein [Xanthobacteraceae bacterium]
MTYQTVDFDQVFESERKSINKRRAAFGRGRVALQREQSSSRDLDDDSEVLRPTEGSAVVGLALSGGGVRSAAFCLGALQALDSTKALDRVDYLSTVSGGGYIGSSLTAGMTENGGKFPFTSELSEDEPLSLQHVRDYSNYLFPKGAADLSRNAAIYLRGLVANAILVMLFILFFAAITVFFNPIAGEYEANFLGVHIWNPFPFQHFVVTIYLGITVIVAVVLWALFRSWTGAIEIPTWKAGDTRSRVAAIAMWIVRFLVFLTAVATFFELQPFILEAVYEQGGLGFFAGFNKWIQGILIALGPLAAAIAFLSRRIGEAVKSAMESERIRDRIIGWAGKGAIYAAALIVPLFLWLLYLLLAYWGRKQHGTSDFAGPSFIVDSAIYLHRFIGSWCSCSSCLGWLCSGSTTIVAQFYLLVVTGLLVLVFFLRPNANSLHPLYRDRLAKAFLFKPQTLLREGQSELDPLQLKLTGLSDESAPYHLINTALNVGGSKKVNRRGRNADFFVLSRNYVGSKTTGYVPTEAMQKVVGGLDLATAMAVSGAAASSNMGSATIKPLTPTLALLNIRLGYWLRNPKWVNLRVRLFGWANFYFLLEMFGLLNENRRSIYLTDGGHIENLGIYELLRRRCRVIIAVDGEADRQMAFGSLNTVERYALIDLGVRINLPWGQISEVSKAIGKVIDAKGDALKYAGPHVAIGEIEYPDKRRGILIYIKASLTGDENDYIFHYKRRYGDFPHETTLDQLFSEEQFEAYRALGFHATYRFFDREDWFAHLDRKDSKNHEKDIKFLDRLFPLAAKRDPAWKRRHNKFVGWFKDEEAAPDILRTKAEGEDKAKAS